MPESSQSVGEKRAVAVIYGASVESARVVAQRVATGLRERGFPVEMRPFREAQALDLTRCAAAVVVAPVPLGQEEKLLAEFLRTGRGSLERMPAAFLSLSVAGPSRPGSDATPEDKGAQFVTGTQETLERLFTETGWRPTRHWPVAGTVTYRRYNFLVRLILKWLAQGDQDPDRPQGDWQALDAFLDDFQKDIRGAPSRDPLESGPATLI